MAIARTPRSTWIEAGLHALAQGGPSAVRVEAIAKTLGVTKGGFYWQLGDRETLLDEMLTTWEHDVIDNVIADVESEPGDARTKLGRLFTIARSYTRPEAMAIELAIRDWARHDTTVAERLRRIDNRRMTFLRSQFSEFCSDEVDVEARCMLAFALYIGNFFITADHGALTRSEVVEVALATLLA
jgi:AcrR family transcriptional regulator